MTELIRGTVWAGISISSLSLSKIKILYIFRPWRGVGLEVKSTSDLFVIKNKKGSGYTWNKIQKVHEDRYGK